MAAVKDFRELDVYQRAFETANRIYELSKNFPAEERYSLTDQVRRASRSICANIGEAWRKRRYVRSFANKLTDADAEAAETTVWLDFAREYDFIADEEHRLLRESYDRIGAQLTTMINDADRWCRHQSRP